MPTETGVSSKRFRAYIALGVIGALVIVGTIQFSRRNDDDWEDDEWDDEEEASMEKEDETVYVENRYATDFIFHSMQELLETPEGKKNASKVQVVVKIVVTAAAGPKLWVINMAGEKPSVYTATSAKGIKTDCQVTVADADLHKIARGKLHVQSAFLSGKMKIYGNILRAAKIKDILFMALKHDYDQRVKHFEEVRAKKQQELKGKVEKLRVVEHVVQPPITFNDTVPDVIERND